jgi:hypothetical protein
MERTCKTCKYFTEFIPARDPECNGHGFGDCIHPRFRSCAFYIKEGEKVYFRVADYFGCILWEAKE